MRLDVQVVFLGVVPQNLQGRFAKQDGENVGHPKKTLKDKV